MDTTVVQQGKSKGGRGVWGRIDRGVSSNMCLVSSTGLERKEKKKKKRRGKRRGTHPAVAPRATGISILGLIACFKGPETCIFAFKYSFVSRSTCEKVFSGGNFFRILSIGKVTLRVKE